MATDQIETKKHPWSKMITPSLAIAAVILLGSLIAAGVKVVARDMAVDTVNRSGGFAWYDHSWSISEKDGVAGVSQYAPRFNAFTTMDPWLEVVRVVWGDVGFSRAHSFGDLKKFQKKECKVTDEDLASLRSFGHLRQLTIENAPRITDAGLAHLERLTQLRLLSLGGGKITDAGLAHLGPLSELAVVNLEGLRCGDSGMAHLAGKPVTSLGVRNCPITDAGLAVLKTFPALKSLSLHDVPITDAGLAQLVANPGLQILILEDTGATDLGVVSALRGKSLTQIQLGQECSSDTVLAAIRPMTELDLVSVSGPRVTDKGLAHLAELPNLSTLLLTNAEVSDAGLLQLKKLERLGHLELEGTKVTVEGVLALKETLTHLHVILNGRHFEH